MQLKKIFDKKLIISSITLLLITGPFLSDLLVSLSSIIFLSFCIYRNDYKYLSVRPIFIFFAFCLYCSLISIFFAEYLFRSIKSSLFYFRIGLFACLIWYLIDNEKKFLNYFYHVLLFCFSALLIDGYIQFFFGKDLLGYPPIVGYRISAFFGDEAILGSYLSRLFPLLFALFVIKEKKSLDTILFGILFVLVEILIFLSGERTAFAFLNLSALFIILLTKNYKKFRFITLILSMIGMIIVSANNSSFSKRMINETLRNFGLFNSSTERYIFTAVHDSHIRTALNMFKEKPITGHGPKMFREICHKQQFAEGIRPCTSHPHNFYVQLLAETGIIGFSFLFSLFCYVLYVSIKQLSSLMKKTKKNYLTDYQVCLMAAILISIWPFSPNGNFFNNWLAIIYSLPAGFYLQSLYGSRKNLMIKKFSTKNL